MHEIAALISSERLGKFLAITGTERDALTLHLRAMQTAAALMPVTGLIEIALRNAACERLRVHFNVPDWLSNPPRPFRWKGSEANNIKKGIGQAQKAAYAKKGQADKRALDVIAYPNGIPAGISHERRSKARQKVLQITAGDLISQLTMFFWKRLFSSDYEATLWKPSLKKLFPNKTLDRSEIAGHLEVIYVARNRIAHHEPVMGQRLQDTLGSIDFISANFASNEPTADNALTKLLAPYRNVLAREADELSDLLGRFTLS